MSAWIIAWHNNISKFGGKIREVKEGY